MSQPALISPTAEIHPSALIEDGVSVGERTSVWDCVHIRKGATIGHDCIVGEKSYVAYDVTIGNFVKINTAAYLCAGVRVEDFVMISAHVVFTNDRSPRAGNRDLSGLETSAPTADTLETVVERGATIGANATIGPGLTLGSFSMVGMGSVVTRDVLPHQLVTGNPANPRGWVCVCGERLAVGEDSEPSLSINCSRCGRGAQLLDGTRLIIEG